MGGLIAMVLFVTLLGAWKIFSWTFFKKALAFYLFTGTLGYLIGWTFVGIAPAMSALISRGTLWFLALPYNLLLLPYLPGFIAADRIQQEYGWLHREDVRFLFAIFFSFLLMATFWFVIQKTVKDGLRVKKFFGLYGTTVLILLALEIISRHDRSLQYLIRIPK